MLLRLWRTRFEPARLRELQEFADTISSPMFERLDGCQGVIFAVDGDTWLTVTLWTDREAIETAEAAPEYRQTVARILAAGFLRGDQQTSVFEVTGYNLPGRRFA